jgi:hypothetical protein
MSHTNHAGNIVSHHKDLHHAAAGLQPLNDRTPTNISQLIVTQKDLPQALESAKVQAKWLNVSIRQL